MPRNCQIDVIQQLSPLNLQWQVADLRNLDSLLPESVDEAAEERQGEHIGLVGLLDLAKLVEEADVDLLDRGKQLLLL